MKSRKILMEVCAGSVESALEAEKGGADRIELCDNLIEGGTTPSIGMIEIVKKALKIPINILIRPRGGDFLYSSYEFKVILRDIERVKELNVNGIVIGMLNRDAGLDIKKLKEIIKIALPMSITFHRAFDMTKDPFNVLKVLIDLGIHRLLTSGCEITAYEGIDLIKKINEQADGKIIIMAGGGINILNAEKIIKYTGVEEIHVGGSDYIESKMRFRNFRVSMGKKFGPSEYSISRINSGKIRNIKRVID